MKSNALVNLMNLFKRQARKRRAINDVAKSAFCPCHSASGFTYHVCGITEEEGQKIDLLSLVHRNSAPLKSAREAAMKASQRWHIDKYEQTYKPTAANGNSQVELYYDRLGLGVESSSTVIGGKRD